MPTVGRESHDRGLEELEKERYYLFWEYLFTYSSTATTLTKRIMVSTSTFCVVGTLNAISRPR